MTAETPGRESQLSQLRLLLEEICCDLCRFQHVMRDGLGHERIRIDREFALGGREVFADIRVVAGEADPYFVEVKFGYSTDVLVRHLLRKYRTLPASSGPRSRLILLLDTAGRPDWDRAERELRSQLDPGLSLQIWSEERFREEVRLCFGEDLPAITPENLLEVRDVIDRAKGRHAFGKDTDSEYRNDPLSSQLLWHFGFWQLRKLRELLGSAPRDLLQPGHYRGVVVLLADLCSFSSYVRDTRDTEVLHECLTAFYSKSRYQIIQNGGMLYQFVGDEVIGFFGIPRREPGTVAAALETARALTSIGLSVSNHWQRRIDRMQSSGGLHIGMAVGDLQIVSLRPYSRRHMGAIGDCINVASRLMAAAGPGEIVMTNSLFREVGEERQAQFEELEPLEARNTGRIKAWKLRVGGPETG